MEIEKLLRLYMNISALEQAIAEGFTIVINSEEGIRLVRGGGEQSLGLVGFADPTFVRTLTATMGRFKE